MQFRSVLLSLVSVALLCGCAAEGGRRPGEPTQSDLDRETRILRNDPAFRQVVMNECRADARMSSAKATRNMAVLMKVPPEVAPQTFCDRIVGGLENGRITMAQMNAVKRGELSPAMLAVIQGE